MNSATRHLFSNAAISSGSESSTNSCEKATSGDLPSSRTRILRNGKEIGEGEARVLPRYETKIAAHSN